MRQSVEEDRVQCEKGVEVHRCSVFKVCGGSMFRCGASQSKACLKWGKEQDE